MNLTFYILCFLMIFSTISPMNVLLIVTDDLRPELSIYGRNVHTPSFARLASKGIVFDLAYTQYAVCHPSRASFLTGILYTCLFVFVFINIGKFQSNQVTIHYTGVRPDTHNIATFEDATNIPWFDNIFTILTRNGYYTTGVGKLFHQSNYDDLSLFDSGRWDGKWYAYQVLLLNYILYYHSIYSLK